MKPPRLAVKQPRRGEIWLVNFDPTVGAEITKTRPALIIQNDIANRYSPVTIVAAITSYRHGPSYPAEVLVSAPGGGLSADSLILLNQIRTIDKQRLVKRYGKLTVDILSAVDKALAISLALVGL